MGVICWTSDINLPNNFHRSFCNTGHARTFPAVLATFSWEHFVALWHRMVWWWFCIRSCTKLSLSGCHNTYSPFSLKNAAFETADSEWRWHHGDHEDCSVSHHWLLWHLSSPNYVPKLGMPFINLWHISKCERYLRCLVHFCTVLITSFLFIFLWLL
jgi:hypothetical protein